SVRLATKAALHRIRDNGHDDRDRPGCLLDSLSRLRRGRHDDVNIEPNQLGREGWEAIEPALRPSLFEGDVLSLDIAQPAQALPKCLGERRGDSGRIEPQDAYPRDFLRLLRLGERTCAEKEKRED